MYITVEILTSPVALRYLGVMIWEIHIRELWEYFKLWKMTLNRAYAPMSSDPDSEDLFGMKLLYDIIIFFYVAVSVGQGPSFFVCVCFQLSTQDTLVGQRHYDEKIIIEG